MPAGYTYGAQDLAELLLRNYYPERTNRESAVLKDFLMARGRLYDRFEFSVRVGQGVAPDPSHMPEIQQQAKFNYQKRIDLIVWRGAQPTIVDAKERVTAAVIGQLRQYRHLLLEDRPDMKEPTLMVIGRYSDADTLRVLHAEGIDVLLYTPDNGSGGPV